MRLPFAKVMRHLPRGTSASPSPRPSPSGRGRDSARHSTNLDAPSCWAHWRRSSLSPGERGGVRGKSTHASPIAVVSLNGLVQLRSPRAFTLIEIAICLAIIAFALVAIIGVMPLGMTVQRDNRADSIINQDGMYWLNAIRSGATGTVDLVDFVHWVTNSSGNGFLNNNNLDSRMIIGLLSAPTTTNTSHRAKVRSITGSAVERDRAGLGYDYILFTQVLPFTDFPPANLGFAANLSANLYELRVVLRYPALPNDSFGNGKKVFRCLVSGTLANEPLNSPYFFFQPQTLVQQ